MSELTAEARHWLTGRHQAVLVTLRGDGSAQTSNVVTAFDGEVFRVSVTAGRAKTRNLTRDPRAVMHVLGPDFWSFASVRCTAHLGEVSTGHGDQAAQDLLALYDAVADTPHPNQSEFFDVQVAEQRVLLTLRADDATGMGWTR